MTCTELLIEFLKSLSRKGELDLDDYIEMPKRDLIDGITALEEKKKKER